MNNIEAVARWLYHYTTPGMSGESGADASCNPEKWESCPKVLKVKYRKDALQIVALYQKPENDVDESLRKQHQDWLHEQEMRQAAQPDDDLLLSDKEIEEVTGVEFKTAYSGHIKEYHAITQAQLAHLIELGYKSPEEVKAEKALSKFMARREIADWLKINRPNFYKNNHGFICSLEVAQPEVLIWVWG